jgi:outer membrane protein insertion porin family
VLKWISSILLVFILIGVSNSQVRKLKVNSIVIEGNKDSQASSIRLNSGLLVGNEIAGEDLQQAVKNLWALGVFSDIQIFIDNQTTAGVDLIIKVSEYPRLNKIVIKGNDEFDADEIENDLTTYKRMIVSDYRLFKIKQTIKSKYLEEGYLLAEINIDTSLVSAQSVNINIDIKEGEEVQIEGITFYGNEEIEDDDLKDAMDEIQEDRWWRSADFDPKKYEEDKLKVIQYYRENGFRDAEVLKDSTFYSEDNTDMYIEIWVYEGNKYHFGDMNFSGNTIFSNEELSAALDLTTGDVYDQLKYDEGIRDRLQKMYYNQGYLFAQIQPIETPIGKDTLDVNFNITEGHVVHVNEIQIRGNTKTHEKVIRREFKIQPGDIFNSSKLERSIRDVTILNYFGNIIPNVNIIEDDDKHVNLEVAVEEKSTDMANMSAGYSQRDGLIGSLGLTFNNFSMAHPFTGGDGQRLVFDWQFGRIYRSISVSFTEPWLFNTPTLGGFSIFNTRTGGGYYPWDRKDIGGTIHLGRRFQWPDNYFRGDWIFRYAQTTIDNITDQQLLDRYYAYGTTTNTKQLSVTQIITRDSRNNPEFPTFGSVHSLSTQLSGGPLGGDAEYIKAIFNAEWYVPMPLGFVLYTKNTFGALEKISDNTVILLGEYFYLGGSGLGFSESLRGYDDGQVGPLSTGGSPLGGKTMYKTSAELRFPISPNPTIFGLFFAEGGNAWENLDETDPFNLRRSVGAGLRLFMPMIGIIGIDFGYGFDHFNAEGKREGQWKVHFQFGRF